MVALNNCVLKINYCPCESCERMLVKLGTFQEVKEINKDAEPHKVTISITGDPYIVTEQLKKHHKKFEYCQQSSPMNNLEMQIVLPQNPVPEIHDQCMIASKSSVLEMNYCSSMNNQEMPIVLPQAPVLGINDQHMVAKEQQVDETIVKKTHVCCPKCNHELELKRYDRRFACDGCKEDGFGSRYRCQDCDYSLHEECASPKPFISPDFLQGSTFEFHHQPCSTCVRPCYACGKSIRGYYYRCKSKQLYLHPYCSNLKCNLYGMDFVRRDKISSSSKSICCKKKMYRCTKTQNPGSCSYVSTCKKYHFHVYCITEMLHEAWKEGKINVSANEMSMPPEIMELQLRTHNKNSSGGRFGEILKTLSTFLGTIIGILLGDPTGALVPVLFEFFLNTLPKLLQK